MNFRFVDEHDPVARRRRRLQAERTQRFRQGQKANQAESSRIVEPVVDNVQTEPEDSLLTDTGKFGPDEISSRDTFITPCQEDDDSGIIDTEPAYYDEEPVNTQSAEEREYQTESRSREVYAEVQADLLDDIIWNDIQYATHKFVQQYFVGISGCGAQEHRESLTAHMKTEGASNHHGIDKLFPRNVPHTLNKQYFFKSQTFSKTLSLSSTQWQELFSGHTPRHFEGKPKQACLHTEQSRQTPPVISFDIDSILGFVTSPAAAVDGIRFYSAPQYRQNISTDIHLTLDRMDQDPGPNRESTYKDRYNTIRKL